MQAARVSARWSSGYCPAQRIGTPSVTCFATKINQRRMHLYKHPHEHTSPCVHIELEPDGSDVWRLDSVPEMLQDGAVGIIPTDSYPALVCDLENAEAVKALSAIKHVSPKKPMSILVRNFSDVDTYTQGWPKPPPGMPDWFKLVRKVLPGGYTFILPASKMMPKTTPANHSKHHKRQKQRHTVGVRMPAHPVTQHLLSLLPRPLLCTSAHVADDEGFEFPDAATMIDMYPDIDFIVDCGPSISQPSTVVDMTESVPEVLRAGIGEPALFDPTNTF